MLADVVNGERPSVEQKDDDGFAGGQERLDQCFLPSDEIQARPISQVVPIPRLARSLLVATDRQHDDIGPTSDSEGSRDLLAVFVGIAGDNLILVPRAATRDFAVFAVQHLDAAADLRFDAVEHGDVVLRHAAVTTEQTAVRIRADDRDALDGVRIQGQQIVPVFQERDGFTRGLQRELAIRVATHNALRLVGIHVRIVEEPHLEFPEQHRRHQFIQL